MSRTGLLVGFGSIGRRHLANLHALGVTDWAVVHTGRGTLPFEPPTPVRTYPDLASALAAESPAFAVVANPTALHLAAAQACAERGCDVLLEKPVSDRTDGLDDLAATVRAGGVEILVGFQFRYHPALHAIRALLDDGTIGAPCTASVVWAEHLPDWHPWEDWRTGYAARPELGGGVHHTICHPFDYLRALFGEVVTVGAHLSDRHPLGLEVPEAVDVRLGFATVDATVHLDYWSRPQTHRLEVTGTLGSVVWDYIAGTLSVRTADDTAWQVRPVPGVAERNDLFLAQSRHFLDVVARTATPECTLADGMAAVRIADAIERSSAADGRNVAP